MGVGDPGPGQTNADKALLPGSATGLGLTPGRRRGAEKPLVALVFALVAVIAMKFHLERSRHGWTRSRTEAGRATGADE